MFIFFFYILRIRLFGNLSCPFRFRSSLWSVSGPVKFLTRFHACFVPARFSGAFSCPFDLLIILNAFSRFPACAHAHSFFKSLHFSGPLGSLFLSPSLSVGKFNTHVRSCFHFNCTAVHICLRHSFDHCPPAVFPSV